MVAYDYDKQKWVKGEEAAKVVAKQARQEVEAIDAGLMPDEWFDGDDPKMVRRVLNQRLRTLEGMLQG